MLLSLFRCKDTKKYLKMREINEEYPIPPIFFMEKYPIPLKIFIEKYTIPPKFYVC